MKLVPKKGYTLTEPEWLQLGGLLLKMGYIAHIGKEKVGTQSQRFVEVMEKVPVGVSAAAEG